VVRPDRPRQLDDDCRLGEWGERDVDRMEEGSILSRVQ
jgi:hypothetical protein